MTLQWPSWTWRLCFIFTLWHASVINAQEQVETLALPTGSLLRIRYASLDYPTAVLIMLPGGAGHIGLEADGQII